MDDPTNALRIRPRQGVAQGRAQTRVNRLRINKSSCIPPPQASQEL